ncbi:hypothetical protein M5D96_007862 [Drosophila gunungcola]|uniref:Uncharacterized protein n=1 Tax=Drosophila gunungcola TaxID=103775 RepID=A0A9P9YLD0_9MUSC|nr:hypothetical protein M5D96_007862 [Drosophila gunungcola]
MFIVYHCNNLFLFLSLYIFADQGTQTDSLLITEEEPTPEFTEQTLDNNGVNKTPLRKSASFSSTSTSSPASSSMGSATSTMSLRSSTPLRNNHNHSQSSRALRSDTINTFQKWETTIESISYVSTKTVSISDFSQEPQLREQTGKHNQNQSF